MTKVKVLKRNGVWHWWCQDCMGGGWTARYEWTLRDVRGHFAAMHAWIARMS